MLAVDARMLVRGPRERTFTSAFDTTTTYLSFVITSFIA